MPRTSASAAQFKTGDDQEWLSVSYEASLGRAGGESKKTSRRRKQLGAFYTPMILADVLVELSVKPWLKEQVAVRSKNVGALGAKLPRIKISARSTRVVHSCPTLLALDVPRPLLQAPCTA